MLTLLSNARPLAKICFAAPGVSAAARASSEIGANGLPATIEASASVEVPGLNTTDVTPVRGLVLMVCAITSTSRISYLRGDLLRISSGDLGLSWISRCFLSKSVHVSLPSSAYVLFDIVSD